MRLRSTLLCLLLSLPVARITAQPTVSFGVLGLFHPRELELRPADAQVLTASSDARTFVLNGERGHRLLEIRAAGDRILVSGLAVPRLHASARDSAKGRFSLAVPDKLKRVYEGILTITARRGELIVIVTMEREEAVASIVASEMPGNAPLEALKAQAVVTRSFLAAGGRHHDFEFCDTTHCQFLRSPDDAGSAVRQAVNETRGMVLTWNQHPLAAMYSSRCGGQTSSMRDVGMDPGGAYPYYAVPCPWCREHPLPWRRAIEPGRSTPQAANEPDRIKYARQWGWSALPGNQYSITHDAEGDSIQGRNIGHGLGLCQWGAIGMASQGRDFRSILQHYYPNSDLQLFP